VKVYIVTIEYDKPKAFSSYENALKHIEEKSAEFINNKLVLKFNNENYWFFKDNVQSYRIFLEEVV
jgi:hypothetical protein